MPAGLRVAVIGAGAAGLCAARHVLSRPRSFAPPVVFEQSGHVGGTWFYEEQAERGDGRPVHSSMYRDLRTNLPKEVMMFPDFPFEPQLPSFLPHQEVQRYLESYSERHGVRPHIRFHTLVEEVNPVVMETEGEEARTTWAVTSSDESGRRRTETFCSVFVCTGHYSDPHIPNIPGIENFTGSLLHSHSYREPEPFSGRSVVVLGASASGLDISLELAAVGAQVTLSHARPDVTLPASSGVQQVAPVVAVEQDGSLRLQDGSRRDADVLLLCTGYRYSFPFLRPARLGLDVRQHLVTPLYLHLVPPAFPSLFFIGICQLIVPFPCVHVQVQFALAVLQGSVSLPSRAVMEEEVRREQEEKTGRGVAPRHLLRLQQEQWSYYEELARRGGFAPPPPVTRSLYEEVWRQRRHSLGTYRSANYRLLSATRWEARPGQGST
ncbi:flavin-containing monooxygenase FMO GS-OX5 [Myripristis murdjan]|uniref:Flavin-containing monooxygenase n=1 Tax=Myripristis murdjan TaxID=586833 RepID=A0A667ZCT4_9TELE|nr:flavin-containing monooxygenase FMO GS-OX5-like [Myripristis murdjan]XP_029924330.1 flavin-containing monooxygenase FMO GS-OX5-like [Myripristis murdjan]